MYMRIDFLFSYLIQIQGKYQTHFVRENSNFENIFCEKKTYDKFAPYWIWYTQFKFSLVLNLIYDVSHVRLNKITL